MPPHSSPSSSSGFTRSTVAAALLTVAAALIAVVWVVIRPKLGGLGGPPPLTLSVFEPHAGGCAWSQLDARSRAFDGIAVFPSDCPGVRVSWTDAGDAALVWFPPAEEDAAANDGSLFRVALPRGTWQRMPLPTTGDPELIAFDSEGRPVALTIDQSVETTEQNGVTALRVGDGLMPLPSDTEGQPALAHATTFDDGGWRTTETKATRCCAPGAPGVASLVASAEVRAERAQTSPATPRPLVAPGLRDDLEARTTLRGSARPGTPWYVLTGAGWNGFVAARAQSPEDARLSGLAYLVRSGTVTDLPGFAFSPQDAVAWSSRRAYLLAVERRTGMEPHLYDMTTGQLVWSSTVAHAVSFWPAADTSQAPQKAEELEGGAAP